MDNRSSFSMKAKTGKLLEVNIGEYLYHFGQADFSCNTKILNIKEILMNSSLISLSKYTIKRVTRKATDLGEYVFNAYI